MENGPTRVINYKNQIIGVNKFFSKHKRLIIFLLLISSYILFYFILDFSTQSLVAHDEGLYARRSRLVEESYNWFSTPFSSPHHKTIGSYWLIALSMRFLGNNELALRLPSILTSFLSLITWYLIARKITCKKSALISLFSLSSMPLWIQYSRYASPDLPFVLCILLIILFFLNFIDSNKFIYKSFYIFFSGLFISTAFFIRSYMIFVPLIGLLPFLLFHLFRTKTNYKVFFCSGLLVGFIPTFLNLYFSYRKFGILGITSLFDFAKKQAIGGFDFTNLLLIPLNYLYFTFPTGIILLILFVCTRPNKKVNYPLLTYCFPYLSVLILLCMSTSYPHYYLFLLPSLSLLFSVHLQSYSFRFSTSQTYLRYLLFALLILVSVILVSIVFYLNDSLIDYSFRKIIFVYIVPVFLALSIISSSRYLFENRNFNLKKFFYNIIIPQYIFISLLYNFGMVGNPNSKTKVFINDEKVSSIIKSNKIYLFKVDTKIKTLLSYYLPSSEVVKSIDELKMYNYIITSDPDLIYDHENKYLFKSIKNFDNHFLLMNITK